MFKLTENKFVESGICKYTDEYNNRLFFKRNDKGFVAKIRFADNRIFADPMYVSVPAQTEEEKMGQNMNLHKKISENDARMLNFEIGEDVATGIKDFTLIVQRWVNMLYDIAWSGINNNILREAYNKNLKDEDIWGAKIDRLLEYEELHDFIEKMYKNQ